MMNYMTSGNYAYTISGNGTIRIMKYCGYSDETVVIPESIDGYKVTELDPGAFCDCAAMLRVVIPGSIEKIEDNTFAEGPFLGGAHQLQSITLMDGVKEIGAYAFSDCTELESIELSRSIVSIGESAFEGCESLASVSLPDTVQSVGDNAFEGCYSLRAAVSPVCVSAIFASCGIRVSVTAA